MVPWRTFNIHGTIQDSLYWKDSLDFKKNVFRSFNFRRAWLKGSSIWHHCQTPSFWTFMELVKLQINCSLLCEELGNTIHFGSNKWITYWFKWVPEQRNTMGFSVSDFARYSSSLCFCSFVFSACFVAKSLFY